MAEKNVVRSENLKVWLKITLFIRRIGKFDERANGAFAAGLLRKFHNGEFRLIDTLLQRACKRSICCGATAEIP